MRSLDDKKNNKSAKRIIKNCMNTRAAKTCEIIGVGLSFESCIDTFATFEVLLYHIHMKIKKVLKNKMLTLLERQM